MPQTTPSFPPSLHLVEGHSCSFMWFVRIAVILTALSLFHCPNSVGEARYHPLFAFVPSTHSLQKATNENLQRVVNAASLLWIRGIKARELDFATQPGQSVLSHIVLKNGSQLEMKKNSLFSFVIFFSYLQPENSKYGWIASWFPRKSCTISSYFV